MLSTSEEILIADLFCNGDFPAVPGLFDLINGIHIDEIWQTIQSHRENLLAPAPNNIPQFSNTDEIDQLLNVVANVDCPLNFQVIGSYLRPSAEKAGAQRKYGENHYKLASSLGLTTLPVYGLSVLGEEYYHATDPSIKKQVLKKLVLRIPIVQQALFMAMDGHCCLKDLMEQCLSESTAVRRKSNIFTLMRWVEDISDTTMLHLLNRITWE